HRIHHGGRMSSRLQVNQVDVNIGQARILSGFSIDIRDGEMVGLVGRNGAGKSTLLRTILGMLPARNGDITFDGQRLAGVSPHERARLGIGYMPEDRGLIGGLTVRQNLALPVWARKRKDLDERLERVIEIVPELRELLALPALTLS